MKINEDTIDIDDTATTVLYALDKAYCLSEQQNKTAERSLKYAQIAYNEMPKKFTRKMFVNALFNAYREDIK